MKTLRSQKGMIDFVLIGVVLVAAIGFAAYVLYQQHQTQVAQDNAANGVVVQRHINTASWKMGQLTTEKLKFLFPNNWTLTRNGNSNMENESVVLTSTSGFGIIIASIKPNTFEANGGGADGAINFNTTVGTFTLAGKPVYLLDAKSNNGSYSGTVASACSGNKKCLVHSTTTANLVDISITYTKPGTKDPQAPDEFKPSTPDYNQAIDIVKTLSYQS